MPAPKFKNAHRIADDLWEAIEEHIPEEDRPEVAELIIDVFEDHGGKMTSSTLWEVARKPNDDEDDDDEDDDSGEVDFDDD